jgi:high affinity Mn2+ porin
MEALHRAVRTAFTAIALSLVAGLCRAQAPEAGKPAADKPAADAASEGEKPAAETKPEWWSIHGQGTVVSQGNWKFTSPYVGPNSLLPILNYRTTETATLFLDARPWQGGEILFNPEIAGGTGLSNTLGLAGFPNGEATRVGSLQPTPFIARALLRQTFPLDGAWEKLESDANQLPGYHPTEYVAVSVGKLAATDYIDTNKYSHDPRTQFLNWSIMYNGAWDYPANVRGYTYGAVFEASTIFWAARLGFFAEPSFANSAPPGFFDPHFIKAHGQIVEIEQKFILGDNPAKLREWGYLNQAHMGSYRDSLALSPVNPDVTATRAYRIKYGFGIGYEQQLTRDLGLFVKAGWNDGQTESWAFTEIDATAAAGLLLQGRAWSRPKDTVGVAAVVNGLSDAHKDYLAAGGIGFIIGDGRLKYAPEEIVEAFYNWEMHKGINLSLDVQGVENPAYNQDRGPVFIAGVRMHFEY